MHHAATQPTHFAFNAENLAQAKAILKKYPDNRKASAALPLLDLAQRQSGGWLPRVAIEAVADFLDVPRMRMLEVASFYSMFNLAPVGKYLVQICRTTPCWLRGSDALTEVCKKKLGIELKQTSGDEKFTIMEVECLGACANAPMVQINDDYFEDLTPAKMEVLLDHLSKGKPVQPGSQTGRQASAPQATVSPEDGYFERVDISETLNDLKETDMAVAKKTTAKKTVAKKPAVKKVAAKKPAAKKPVAKAAVKKTASKTAVKKPAVKKVAAKKPAAKKTVAKKK